MDNQGLGIKVRADRKQGEEMKLQWSTRTSGRGKDGYMELESCLEQNGCNRMTLANMKYTLTFLGPVHSVPQLELVRVLCLGLLQLLSQKNVRLGLVGKQEGQVGGVPFIPGHLTHQLQHGGDACATWGTHACEESCHHTHT